MKEEFKIIRFGIIGCGVIAFTHAKALEALAGEGCALYACCDTVPERADQYARDHGAEKVYYDDESILADPDVDVVCVCVPSGLHGELCEMAARAGKHIVCEKPLEITPERAMAACRAAREAGVKVQSIHQRRTMPSAIAVREAIRSGKLGRVCLAEADLRYYRDQAYYDSGDWRGTWELDGGGAVMNQGVHGVDLILWMLGGEVETVYGRAGTLCHDIPVEDTAAALLQMADGSVCVIKSATSAYPGFSTAFTVHGSKGTVAFNDEGITEWTFMDESDAPARPDAAGGAMGGSSSNVNIAIYGHITLLRDMAQAIREDREPMLPPEDALPAIRVICALYESSRRGQPVRLT